MEMNKPLVTIVVVTYNSSKYVIDTLISIKDQTYSNLELIISDDCSTDSTIDICKNFILQNQDVQFVKNAKIVTTLKNSGITPNYNNGLKHAKGEWIKFIAGDDILLPECIDEYVNIAIQNNEKLYVSGIIPFETGGINALPLIPDPNLLKGNADQQFKSLVTYGTFIAGPTIFVERNTLNKFGGFSEQYPFIEDFPLFIKFLLNSERIFLIDKPLVKYRRHKESLSHMPSDNKMGSSLKNHYWDIIQPELKNRKMWLFYFHNNIVSFLEKKNDNVVMKNIPVIKYIIKMIDPISWYDFYLKKIKKTKLNRP